MEKEYKDINLPGDMEAVPGEDDAEFQRRYLDLINKIRLLSRKYKASYELPPAEFHMLSMIAAKNKEKPAGSPGVTTTEIMELLGISISGASKLLGAMERKGYIKRVPSNKDRRVSYLSVTSRGEVLLDSMTQERNRMLRKLYGRLGVENMMNFMHYIEVLYDVMREEWEEKENG